MIYPENDIIQCKLFLDLDEAAVSEILSKSQSKKYAPGEVLIRKDQIPQTFFIIRSGKVGIYNEDILLAELSDLSIMGESILDNDIATATIVVATDLSTVEIKKEDFYALTEKYPKLVSNIFKINFERLRVSNDAALQEARVRAEKSEQLVAKRTKELNDTLDQLRSTNKELSLTRDNLLETQKFREQFLANMSHEIRTPMNAIVGLTNLLIKTSLTENNQKYLNVIKKSGTNLLVIINDILDLAKIEAGKMELESVPFSLPETLNNLYTILSLKAEEKEIYLKKIIGEGVPEYVVGDETRLSQVLMNLAGNAIKFTEKGSVAISVTAEKNIPDQVNLTFSIKDTGIGIPGDKIDKIFESFVQASADTTRKFGGSGLGLTISKQLVEMHGSKLKVKSKPGEGSEFYFTISYQVESKPKKPMVDEVAATREMKGKKILLVEDNEFNQLVAVDTLQFLFPGLDVDVAETGIEAVRKANENTYSFIFMDIQLPDIDGFETTRRIRSNSDETKKNIRICAMTASVTKARINDCFSVGMNDYLMKPFSPEMLKEKVIHNTFSNDEINSPERYLKTKKFILAKLKNELPESAHYHSLHHVMDVLEAATMIGEAEKISTEEMELLKVAVLFHDSGYLISSKKHEELGCELVRENLPGFGYGQREIEVVCAMIMSTKSPQRPVNLLEKIICDADLDYLGRNDFFAIGNLLFKELISEGTVSNEKEWNLLQEKFLSAHSYFTKTSVQLRNAGKKKHLEQIREKINSA